ncbi:MAG: DNA primase [Gammaproteobacteria bacterium]|jgi:DNA primase|nr:DNA primase [Gammaproteobacteria bacterium]
MAGLIPQAFIDELLARVDIVSVIDARVPLKKAGHEYKACCPFHNEKTPSFYVSPSKQFYHCFGCGAHGTAVGFLMEYERLEFPDAIEDLARDLGLEVPHEQGSAPHASLEPLDELRELLDKVNAYYQLQLREHSQRTRAVDYLKARGVDGPTAARFGIGYAPPGWDGLRDALGSQASAGLLKLGLLVERGEGGGYDRFRDRVMFPIRDRRGRVVGFGGRTLADDPAKYMNSPESVLFHKGRELYGLYEARAAVRQLERLVVVEGYMDVVALAQHGIPFAVATLGTATTTDHLDVLYRAAPEVVFCFDGDRAGRQAAWRALDQALPAQRDGRQARFLFLPEGEDPDSLVRSEGEAGFRGRLEEAMPLSEYLVQELSAQVDTRSVDGRARLAELARPLVGKVPEGVFRQLLFERLGEEVQLDGEKLSKLITKPEASPAPPRTRKMRPGGGPSPVRVALGLLLRRPQLAERVASTAGWAETELPGSALLVQMIDVLREAPGITTGGLLERWREDPEGRHLHRLLEREDPVPEAGIEAEFDDTVRRLDALAREARLEVLLAQAEQGGLDAAGKEELRDLLGRS